MSKVFKNNAIVSPSYDGRAKGVNFVALNEGGDSGQSVNLDIPHKLEGLLSPIYTFSTARVSTTNNGDGTYTFTNNNDAAGGQASLILSKSYSGGDLIRDILSTEVVKISLRIKASSNSTTSFYIFNAFDEGIKSGTISTINTWEVFEFILPATGDTSASIRFDTPAVLGESITVDMSSIIISAVTTHDVPYEVDGVELVTNWDFLGADLSLWGAPSGASLAIVGERLQVTNGTGNADVTFSLTGLTPGNYYTVSIDYDDNGTVQGSLVFGSTFLGSEYQINLDITTGKYGLTFLALTTELHMYRNGGNTGEVTYFDNVSVKEVTLGAAHLTVLPKATGKHKTLGNTVTGGSGGANLILGDSSTFDYSQGGWARNNSGVTLSWQETDKTLLVTNTEDWSYSTLSIQSLITAGESYVAVVEVKEVNHAAPLKVSVSKDDGESFTTITGPGVYEVPFVGSSVWASIQIRPTTAGLGFVKLDNIRLEKVMPVSTTYPVAETFGNAFTTDVPLLDADRTILDVNPNAVFELLQGSTTTGLSFSAGNVKNYWPGNEGVASGAYLQDITSAGSATNLVPRSNDISHADWGKTECSITSTTAAAPDGSSTATEITFSGSTYSRFLGVADGFVYPINNTFVFSVYMKAGPGINYGGIGVDNGAGYWGNVRLNFNTGLIEQYGMHPTPANSVWPHVESVGDGWFLLSFTMNIVSSSLPFFRFIGGKTINAFTTYGTYYDTAAGDTMYIWRPQINEGRFRTPYTETSGSATAFGVGLPAKEIAAYTANCRSLYLNQDIDGFNNLLVEQDPTGRPVAVRDPYSANLKNAGSLGKSVGIGYKPNTPNYTIMECISGELQDFGPELVTNGTFDTDTVWIKQSSWTISNGVASCDGTSLAFLYEFLNISANTNYIFEFEVTEYTSGNLYARIFGGDNNESSAINSVGIHSVIVNSGSAPNGNTGFNQLSFIGSIDNVSVRELTTKTQREEFRVLTHEAEALGDEGIATWDFLSSTGWVVETGWSIAGGVASLSAAVGTGWLKYNVSTIIGKTYRVEIKINALTGRLNMSMGGISIYEDTNAGVYTFDFKATGTLSQLQIYPTGAIDAELEYASVKEVYEKNELRINQVLQPTPVLPDPELFIDADGTANIGYPDTVDAAHASLRVWTSAKTPAEQLAYINDVIMSTRDVQLDGEGNPIPDANGVYLYN